MVRIVGAEAVADCGACCQTMVSAETKQIHANGYNSLGIIRIHQNIPSH